MLMLESCSRQHGEDPSQLGEGITAEEYELPGIAEFITEHLDRATGVFTVPMDLQAVATRLLHEGAPVPATWHSVRLGPVLALASEPWCEENAHLYGPCVRNAYGHVALAMACMCKRYDQGGQALREIWMSSILPRVFVRKGGGIPGLKSAWYMPP